MTKDSNHTFFEQDIIHEVNDLLHSNTIEIVSKDSPKHLKIQPFGVSNANGLLTGQASNIKLVCALMVENR
jgi:hypothetical protein